MDIKSADKHNKGETHVQNVEHECVKCVLNNHEIAILKIENGKRLVKEFVYANNIHCPDIENRFMGLTTEDNLQSVIEKIVSIILFKGYAEFLVDMFKNEDSCLKDYRAEVYEEWSIKHQEYSAIYKSSNLAISCLMNKISPYQDMHDKIFSICVDTVNDIMKDE